MKKFDHPNVLNILGVGLDAETLPFILLPFMINRDLKTYLRSKSSQISKVQYVTIKCTVQLCMCILRISHYGMNVLYIKYYVNATLTHNTHPYFFEY